MCLICWSYLELKINGQLGRHVIMIIVQIYRLLLMNVLEILFSGATAGFRRHSLITRP